MVLQNLRFWARQTIESISQWQLAEELWADIPQAWSRHFRLGGKLPWHFHCQYFFLFSFWNIATMTSVGENCITTNGGTKKGKIFCLEDELCCKNFLHSFINSMWGIGQKNTMFWSSVALHYNRHKPKGEANRPSRSLETKWGDIKVAVAKFIGCYWAIKDLNESDKSKTMLL